MESWKNGILAFKTFEELMDCSSLEDPSFHYSSIPIPCFCLIGACHGE
jgi:hypothetical protein